MDIAEMHVWFRQYAQQMGMQNVRAILPEQIDILINTSISDMVNQLVRENIGVRNDRVVTDNTKLNQVNALRSLYKVEHVTAGPADNQLKADTSHSSIGLFSVEKFITENTPGTDYAIDNVLYIVDLSVEYRKGTAQPPALTKIFPVRIIEDAYLADTLNDFVLKPRVRNPIAVIYQDKLDVYFGEEFAKANGLLPTDSITPYELRVSYIAAPNKVSYVSDLDPDAEDIDCNLPESMHVDILKHAVDLYNTSISGGLYAAQQNQQVNQRELSRNEARPTNEGYQN